MTRHVLCLDGTNNRPNGGYTNIQRLFRMLKRDEEQRTYYQPGVGTLEPGSVTSGFGKRTLMLVDSMSAIFIERHVCAAYRYLMEQWQEDDELHLFGFSRGAFAARVLAGMLARVGLLHRGFDEMVPFAWKAYLAPWVKDGEDSGTRFRRHYARYLPEIRFIGLFDSVSSVGLPWVPRRFAYTFDNPRVKAVRQALALDERRVMFVQNRWTAKTPHGTDVEQVWFAGNHSDIGGGYPEREAGLSLITLAWMKREAEAAGLEFKPIVSKEQFGDIDPSDNAALLAALAQAHAAAPVHDELGTGSFWWLLEWLPIPRLRRDSDELWRREWLINRGQPRSPHRDVAPHVHRSVERRMRGGYRPRATLHDPIFVE